MCEISEEYLLFLHHELILLKQENLKIRSQEKCSPAIKKWGIQSLFQDKKLWSTAKKDWDKFSKGQIYLTSKYIKKDLDKKVEWFVGKTTELFNSHAKITKVCVYSKRWWNKDVVEARLNQTKDKKKFEKDSSQKQELKQAQNM